MHRLRHIPATLMSGSDLTPALICAALSLVLLAVSLHLRRRQRLLADLPTSKIQGVFIGLVELGGTAESEAPLNSYLAETACVHYAFDIQEEWSRTVTETYTDKDGKTQTRTRQESGWTNVANGGETQDFYLRDDTGAILVRPAGAKLEPATVYEQTVSRGDPLYYGKGPSHSIADSRHRRRFVERAIVLHTPLYLVGQAREREDIVAPEIARSPDAPLFLISTRTEKSIQRGQSIWSWVWWTVGLGLSIVTGAVFQKHTALPPFIPVLTYLILWGITWTWMVFNSLISLRARVRQGWSLIDVQLKRRHDLIPNLVAVVGRLSDHENTTQTTVAALRSQLIATPPGVSGPDYEGVVGQLRAVIEKYPTLVAQDGFSGLHRNLVETEQRIALARTYYNDIATHFATRLERIPDRWIASLARMQPEPLLTAANFERAEVSVKFADAK